MNAEAAEEAVSVYGQWRTNLALLKSYVRNLKEVIDDLPEEGRDAVEGLDDLSAILQSDGRALGSALNRITGESNAQ